MSKDRTKVMGLPIAVEVVRAKRVNHVLLYIMMLPLAKARTDRAFIDTCGRCGASGRKQLLSVYASPRSSAHLCKMRRWIPKVLRAIGRGMGSVPCDPLQTLQRRSIVVGPWED